MYVLPGLSGNHGLSTRALKSAELMLPATPELRANAPAPLGSIATSANPTSRSFVLIGHTTCLALPHSRAPGSTPLLHEKGSTSIRGGVASSQSARFGPIGMEQLWNRGGATAGKRSALRKGENGFI